MRVMTVVEQARLLRDCGQLAEAQAACQAALELEPDDAEARRVLATVLQRQGHLAEAEAVVREAIELDPHFAKAHKKLGDVLSASGRLNEAADAYREALRLHPRYVAPRFVLAHMKRFERDDEDLEALEALYADGSSLSENELTLVCFALAKAYEDVGDDDRAFERLHEANRRKRATTSFDLAAFERYLARIGEVFQAALLDRFAGAGSDSRIPVFVVGMPRSGTSLVEQILASHPAVHGAGELWDVTWLGAATAALNAEHAPYPDGVELLGPEEIAHLAEAYLHRVQALAPGIARITDKAPQNFQFVGLIHLLFPEAAIVRCTRDPVDTCLSCYRLLFASSQMDFTYDLRELGRYHRAYARLMEHWRQVLPDGRILEVRYEHLVADVEAQALRLVDYCGLEWDERCLSFHSTDRAVKTASFSQVRQPLYGGSVGKWRRFEKHLGPLLAELEKG
jgi:tetratricopeptide (TPR) repeat protein